MARGTVFQYGDNVDTDVIIPARYLNAPSPAELAKHCMEDIDPDYAAGSPSGRHYGRRLEFRLRLLPGTCAHGDPGQRGGLRDCGQLCPGFSIGMPSTSDFRFLECPEAAAAIRSGDVVSVDFTAGLITDETTGQSFRANGFPPFIEQIIQSGGLLPYLKARREGLRRCGMEFEIALIRGDGIGPEDCGQRRPCPGANWKAVWAHVPLHAVSGRRLRPLTSAASRCGGDCGGMQVRRQRPAGGGRRAEVGSEPGRAAAGKSAAGPACGNGAVYQPAAGAALSGAGPANARCGRIWSRTDLIWSSSAS